MPNLKLLAVLAAASTLQAQIAQTPYPTMSPVDQYLMAPAAEIALARSAAPESISKDADVMVMNRHGYETAVKGKNGFVCIVERSWTAPADNPDFWNPKLRGPVCLNAAAARTYLPLTIKKTTLVLAGASKAQMLAGMKAAFDKKEFPPIEPGAMSYMLARDGYLGDGPGHWHPHLMFFTPLAEPAAWGADMPGAPIYAGPSADDHLTIFFIPVAKWSDGTEDDTHKH